MDSGAIHRRDAALNSHAFTVWPSSEPRSGFVTWLAVDPHPGGTAYATYATYATYANFGGSHVWKSTDWGASPEAANSRGAGNSVSSDFTTETWTRIVGGP